MNYIDYSANRCYGSHETQFGEQKWNEMDHRQHGHCHNIPRSLCYSKDFQSFNTTKTKPKNDVHLFRNGETPSFRPKVDGPPGTNTGLPVQSKHVSPHLSRVPVVPVGVVTWAKALGAVERRLAMANSSYFSDLTLYQNISMYIYIYIYNVYRIYYA